MMARKSRKFQNGAELRRTPQVRSCAKNSCVKNSCNENRFLYSKKDVQLCVTYANRVARVCIPILYTVF